MLFGQIPCNLHGCENNPPESNEDSISHHLQIVNVIPNQFVAQTAAEHKVVSRTFSPKSHVAATRNCSRGSRSGTRPTVKLAMNSFDWARHRREKAAAKLHLTFDLGNRLPSFAIVADAAHHASVRAAKLTAHLILRYLRYLSKWGLSFSRLAALVRGVLWNRRKLIETLRLYGTAVPVKSHAAKPKRLIYQLVFDFPPAGMGQQTC